MEGNLLNLIKYFYEETHLIYKGAILNAFLLTWRKEVKTQSRISLNLLFNIETGNKNNFF